VSEKGSARAPLSTAEAATDFLLRRGWRPTPLRARSKIPVLHGWQQRDIDADEIERLFAPDSNIGVRLGQPSHGLVDVDLDVPEAATVAKRLLPATACFGRAGKPGSHFLYVAEGGAKTRRLTAPDRAVLLEMRSDGAQTAFPPSIHPSGEQIAWEDEREPLRIEAKELERLVALVAAATLLARAWPAPGSRHDASLALAGGLLTAGMGLDQADQLVRAVCEAAGDEETENRIADLHSTAERLAVGKNVSAWSALSRLVGKSTVTRVRHWLSDVAPANQDRAPSSLPRIVVSDRALRNITHDAIAALQAANDPPLLFRQGPIVVRLRRDAGKRLRIEQAGEQVLRHHLARAADFVALRGAREVHAAPPLEVVRDILATPEPPLSHLEALRASPLLRADLSVVTTPGYDTASGVYYAPPRGFELPALREHPSQSDLEAALSLLDEALGGFCYRDAASRANAYALMLTPLLRLVLADSVPIAVISAPQQGTGKSLLAGVVALIATGTEAAVASEAEDEAEWRKLLTSALRQGDELLIIDNLARPMRSAQLAKFVTATIWADRILGRNEMVSLPQRMTLIVTGNNVALGGDLGRRCYLIELDPCASRPWLDRDYPHPDLLSWVATNRAQLLAAAFTVIGAWAAAGRPSTKVPRLGSFSDWCATLGSILAHARIDGFLVNLEAVYETLDAEAEQWESLLAALWEIERERSFTASELAAALGPGGALHQVAPEALQGAIQGPPAGLAVRISVLLRQQANRRYGKRNLRVTRAGKDSHSKVALWRVCEGPG
jgi:hypothetical protein